VELFVGFGGVAQRDRVARQSPLYVRARSLAPLVPLTLGRLGSQCEGRCAELYRAGLRYVKQGAVLFNDPSLEEAFHKAMLNGA
jgi:hypothetical protein